MDHDRTFEVDYFAENLGEIPSATSLPRFFYPGGTTGGRDGLLVRVRPHAKGASPWLGVFAFGMLSPKGINGLFSCPDPSKLCVIAKGAGYIVDVSNPSICEEMKAEPIFGAWSHREANILVVFDYLRLAAYNADGFAWLTKRLSWDGIQVDTISKTHLSGRGWSSPKGRYVPFVVDLARGRHEGGARSS